MQTDPTYVSARIAESPLNTVALESLSMASRQILHRLYFISRAKLALSYVEYNLNEFLIQPGDCV